MNPYTISLFSSGIIVLLCTWAVLAHKVRTCSLDILALGLVCIAAALGIGEALDRTSCISTSQLFMRVGIALTGILYFIRVEIYPRIFKPTLKGSS